MKFKFKLFITFLIYGILLLLFTQFFLFKSEEILQKYENDKNHQGNYVVTNHFFNLYLDDTNANLLSIKDSNIFNKFLSDRKYIDLAKSIFFDVTKKSDKIFKLRYIDKSGIEKICVDGSTSSTLKTYTCKQKNLQNQKNTHYFQAIFNTPKNKIWHSKLDFDEKIKTTIDPVVHMGIPIYIKDNKVGVLVADILMKDILLGLAQSPSNKVYLFDKDGNMLVNSKNNNYFDKYFENNSTIFTLFKENAKNIISNDEYFGKSFYSNKIYLNDNDIMYLVVEENNFDIKDEITNNSKQLELTILILIILSVPMSYLFARIPVRQKKQDDKQKYNQDVLLSLFDLSDAVLFKWNNDKIWSVSSVSKSVYKLLGYTQSDFQNNTISYTECIHHDDLKEVIQEHTKAIRHKAYFFEHKPYRLIRKDGDIKWILHSTVIVRDKNNKITNFVGYLTDVTELKNNEIELQYISRTDQLTKINNRMYTDDILKNQHYRFKRDGEICSIIIVDIDHFKSVNDKYGHLVGDSVLVEFAKILKESIREGDVLGRWGGEEFLIILPHTDLAQAMQLAQKLRSSIDTHLFPTLKHLTASFGVATFEKDMSINSLVDAADKGLYESKKNGRNVVTTIQNTSY